MLSGEDRTVYLQYHDSRIVRLILGELICPKMQSILINKRVVVGMILQ